MTPTRLKIHRTALAALLLVGLAGCASVPPPTAELGEADAAIASVAATPEATRYAADELNAARHELAAAQAAMAQQDYALALRLAAGAQADVDLARAKGRALAARSAVAARTEDNEELRRRLLDQEPLQ